MVQALSSPWQVLTELHHDNNHYLNSFWLWFCSVDMPSWLLRLPALATGLAGPLVAACLLRRHGRLEALLGAALLAGNALLVLMGSEARGYGPAALFCLLALWAWQHHLHRGSGWAALACSLALLLGLLSQLTFLYAWAGLGCWSLWKLWRLEGVGWRLLGRLAGLHGLPLLGFALLYGLDLRHLQIGGAEAGSIPAVLLASASHLLGGPDQGLSAWLYAGFSACLLLGGMGLLLARRQSDWLLQLVGMVLAPACVLVAWQPPFMFARYWTLPLVLGLVLIARVLASLWRAGLSGRLVMLAVLLLALVGNAKQLQRLLRYGRGSYAAALQLIVAESPGPEIVIACDNDFRNQKLINFHGRRIDMADKAFRYLFENDRQLSEWFIVHAHDADARPTTVAWRHGRRYTLRQSFPFAWESGCHWWVYRLLERQD